MEISVVAVGREDDSPVDEPLRVAVLADRLGYREVWAGEGPTWDSFVPATAIGRATERVALTAGPVPVSVRAPYTIARGAASAAAVTGRPVGVALGTASKRVVEGVVRQALGRGRRLRRVPQPRRRRRKESPVSCVRRGSGGVSA